jgi:hypothetical protein
MRRSRRQSRNVEAGRVPHPLIYKGAVVDCILECTAETFVNSSPNRIILEQGLLFFLYGAAVNFGIGSLLLPRIGGSSIVSDFHSSLIIAVTAGLAFGAATIMPLRRGGFDAGRNSWAFVARAGVFGILCTAFAMIILSICEAAALVGRMHTDINWPHAFYYALLDTSTYGMGRVVISVPFGFIYGAIGGLYLRSVMRRNKDALRPPEFGDAARTGALIWSIVGLLFAVIPLIGTACSTVGLVQGTLDLRARGPNSQTSRAVPLSAVIIGGIGVLWFLFSIFVYIMAGYGWFRAR